MTLRQLFFVTIALSFTNAVARIIRHFILRSDWKNNYNTLTYPEYMVKVKKSIGWKRKVKRAKYYDSRAYDVRVCLNNALLALVGLVLLFCYILLSEGEYSVWLDIRI